MYGDIIPAGGLVPGFNTGFNSDEYNWSPSRCQPVVRYPVVGNWFRSALEKQVFAELNNNDTGFLLYEEDNKFDPNAVMVCKQYLCKETRTQRPLQLGYLPKGAGFSGPDGAPVSFVLEGGSVYVELKNI